MIFLTTGSQSTIFTSTCTLKISVFDIEENFGKMIMGRTENDIQDSNCLIWITVNRHFALYSECFWRNAASVKSSTSLNAMDTCICIKVVTFRNTPIYIHASLFKNYFPPNIVHTKYIAYVHLQYEVHWVWFAIHNFSVLMMFTSNRAWIRWMRGKCLNWLSRLFVRSPGHSTFCWVPR